MTETQRTPSKAEIAHLARVRMHATLRAMRGATYGTLRAIWMKFKGSDYVRIAVLAGLLAGCRLPLEPVGAVQIVPPGEWRAAYDSVAACAGRTASFDAVRWYVVPAFTFATEKGDAEGYWMWGHRIFLAHYLVWPERVVPNWDLYSPADQAAIREHGARVVRHEALHDALGREGHPVPPFDVCARRQP